MYKVGQHLFPIPADAKWAFTTRRVVRSDVTGLSTNLSEAVSGDLNALHDAGIPIVAYFTDAGMASTYRQPLERIEEGCKTLLAHASANGAEVAVVEIADGIFQQETAQLLRSSVLRDKLTGVMFAAPDALGAVGGVRHLQQIGLKPFAVSGKVSCSPLASVEAERNTQTPVVSRKALCNPEVATQLVHGFLNVRQAA